MIRSPERKARERKSLRMVVLITQVGICMLVPVFICVFLGRWIAGITGILPLFPVCLLLGIMAGFRSCWMIIARFTGLSGSSLRAADDSSSDSFEQDKKLVSGDCTEEWKEGSEHDED